MTTDELNRIVQKVELPFIIKSGLTADRTFHFSLQGKSIVWEVELWFDTNFPFCLPKAKLLNKSLIGKLPHVNIHGTICIEESDSVLVDYTKPELVVCCFLEEIILLLERVSLKIFQNELHNEIEGYYSGIPLVNSFYKASSTPEKVSLKITYKQQPPGYINAIPVLLTDYAIQPTVEFSNTSKLGDLQSINIPHIPLQESVAPPDNASAITSDYISRLITLVDKRSLCVVQKILKRKKEGRQFFVLFSMPRDGIERTQLLVHFKSKVILPHPLMKFCPDWIIDTYSVRRHNKEYLLERGGADTSLNNKKVAIIGCGSVGGEVAVMLAKSGVGQLTLVDPDKLEADNIYRHRLGGGFLNFMPSKIDGEVKSKSKVHSLASELEGNLPFVKVSPIVSRFENVDASKILQGVDLVIVTVGDPSLSLLLNKQLLKLGVKHAIFCWNEASGYGGHSVSLELKKVCYECLFSNETGFGMDNMLALLKPNQAISKNLTGCAGVFTPFSYLDSSRTAAIAAQQAIDILLGYNLFSVAHTWKGENRFGLQVSERFNQMPLQEKLELIQRSGCRSCCNVE